MPHFIAVVAVDVDAVVVCMLSLRLDVVSRKCHSVLDGGGAV